jgi:hypothetical protein
MVGRATMNFLLHGKIRINRRELTAEFAPEAESA